MLSAEQEIALEIAKEEHNLLILGQAGTGKSFLVKKIEEELRNLKKNVAVLASTGIAARNVEGETLHTYFGILDGRYSFEELEYKLKTTNYLYERLSNVDTIIIDEISMISQHIWDQVDHCAKIARSNTRPFGGAHVVGVGDFYQLKPVPNRNYGDNGIPCYNSPNFVNSMSHKIILRNIQRQNEAEEAAFISAIRKVATGNPDKETDDFMHGLSRDLPPELASESIHIFAQNVDCDFHNAEELEKLPGASVFFTAKDTVDKNFRSKLKFGTSRKHVEVKIDAKVILIANINKDLVNGMSGTITSIQEDGVYVLFEGHATAIFITRHTFAIYDKKQRRNRATREQLPLILAYAITVHKSQGLTLKCVTVHCQHMYSPGQLGVAISRTTSHTNLRVSGYRRSICQQHPGVGKFYGTPSEQKQDDHSCCRSKPNQNVNVNVPDEANESSACPHSDSESDIVDQDSESDNDSDEDQSDDKIVNVEEKYKHIATIISDLAPTETCYLPQLRKSKLIKKYSTDERYLEYMLTLSIKVNEKLHIEQFKSMTDFSKVQKFVYELTLSENFCETINNINPSDDFHRLSVKIVQSLLEHHIKALSNTENVSLHTTEPRPVEASNEGRIRYVTGMCLFKDTKNRKKSCQEMAFRKGPRTSYKQVYHEFSLCTQLRANYHELVATSEYPESLNDTERKQYESHGLYHIHDCTYKLMSEMAKKIDTLLNKKNLAIYRTEMFHEIQKYILQSYKNKWTDHINDLGIETTSDSSYAIFFSVTKRFLKVMFKQFRKDLKNQMLIKSKKSFRTSILMNPGVTIEQIRQRGVTIDENLTTAPMASTSTTPTGSLEMPTIPQNTHITPNPNDPSNKRPVDQSDVNCKVCNGNSNEDWIICSVCTGAFHRRCIRMSIKAYELHEGEGAQKYKCKECRKRVSKE